MNQKLIWITLLAVLRLGIVANAHEEALDAETLLDRVNAAWQGDSFHGIMGLDIVLGGQTKPYKLEVWTLGEELALIRILEPVRDLNSGYLQLGDELWFYSPGVGPVDMSAFPISASLFGAGPSLDDLSHGTLSDDYDSTVEIIDTEGISQYFLTLVPHPDAPVVYGKLEIWVSLDYVMEKLLYYDQREAVVQTAIFTDIIEIGDRKFATLITIEDSYGDQTIQRIENPQFDLDLDAMFFSLETFETWGGE